MRVELLGTGSADGWPNPFCSCPRCAWAREAGIVRRRTSVLVDGSLLIDPGPDIGSTGADLSGVRTVLITHDHPDHLDPAFLLAWAWASGPALVVAGPGPALERCRPWVAPQAPVRFVAVTPGDVLAAEGGLEVRVLPAAHSTTGGLRHDGTAVLYEVTGDARILYATDTAHLPHEDLAEHYDLVLLELTFGTRTDHGTAHLDLPRFGHEVARLRAERRLAAGGRVVAVHLSHHNPTDLADRLSGMGALAPRDGTVLVLPQPDPAGPGLPSPTSAGRPRRLLITGGARSGKSHRAEALARHHDRVRYVATAPDRPDDPEWQLRIAAHRARRPPGWQVVETGDLAAVLAAAEPGSLVLVDCLTLWLTGVVDAAAAWERPELATAAVDRAVTDVVRALATSGADVILVTNEVGSGIVPASASGRLFRDLMGRANAVLARACDDVELVVAGIPSAMKGQQWTTST